MIHEAFQDVYQNVLPYALYKSPIKAIFMFVFRWKCFRYRIDKYKLFMKRHLCVSFSFEKTSFYAVEFYIPGFGYALEGTDK